MTMLNHQSILQRYLSRFSSLSFAMHAHSLYYSTMHQKSNFRHIVVIILPKFEPHLVHIHTDCSFLRSEEHTSELQSRFDLVCRLLLEKKKQQLRPHGYDTAPAFDLSK